MKPSINLAEHIEALRKKEASSPASQQATDSILFWGTGHDKNYLPYLKSCVGAATTFLRFEPVTTLTQVSIYCSTKRISRVISTSPTLLRKLLDWDKKAAPSLSDYAGSYFTIPAFKEGSNPIEVVFIAPLKQLVTTPAGKFMATRIIGKLTRRNSWYIPTAFSWSILTPENEYPTYQKFGTAFLISIDIETFKENATIRCLSYTGFFYDPIEPSGIASVSVVLPLDSEYSLSMMRKFNLLSPPKVFQNGKYDISYLSRYNAPVYNYLYDTANFFHSWYSELPKNLGFLNAFFIREATYWKDLSKTNDLHEYYKYNALDTWGTGNCFLAMILEAPAYAFTNYLLEFPLTFPCHMAEMTGIARDVDKLQDARAVQQEIIDTCTASLNTILDVPAGEVFNVASPLQMKSVLKLLGCSDLKSADEKNLKKARFRHPFNARIINLVIQTRKARKLVSTYLTAGKEFSRPDGTGSRILYALNPHGTDTSRLASREHHFWCGLQIQNIPRPNPDSDIPYSVVKSTLKADPGFLFGEVDYEQAESRDTAYISGDPTMIENVEHSPDFHCANASKFFGIPFKELYDVATNKKLNKPIRQISKNVNHGANYNMGAYVLVDTMGEENVAKAKHLLNLPYYWTYLQVAEHLLEGFHRTFPDVRSVFYPGVIEEVQLTHKLTSKATFPEEPEDIGAWTRYCFSDPSTSKPALNAYIAHPPQSLNAQTLNRAWLKVFREIALNPEHRPNFKLIAQVHDSILFQYREGHEYLCDLVEECMRIPIRITGYDKIEREFVVPVDTKKNGTYWSDL